MVPSGSPVRPLVVAGLLALATLKGPLLATGILSATADAINTTGYEDSPFLAPDGRSVYFMYTPWSVWPVLFYAAAPVLAGPERPMHHINRNPWEDSDIYVSRLQADGTWSVPENMAFNDGQADCCAMTWDGVLFAYQRTQEPDSALTDIHFMSRRADGRWVRQSAGPLVNLPGSSESNPHLTPDGRTLFFTSDRPGGLGKADLYGSSRRADGSWGPPVNLGPLFNTAENDDQIWLSYDARTMYFNRDPGPRVFTSTQINGRWTTPTEVLFGGVPVDGAEASLTYDQSRIVFAQVRPDLEDIVLVTARRQPDGTWGPVSPIACFATDCAP